MKQICAGKALKKIDLNLLLFDVGGPRDIIMADDAVVCGWNVFKIRLILLIFHSLLCIA